MVSEKEKREYLGEVAGLPCYISEHLGHTDYCSPKLEVHHKTGAGMAKKAEYYETMPLCLNHHSAQTPLAFGHSVHKGTKSFEKNYVTQDRMIRDTQKRLGYGG